MSPAAHQQNAVEQSTWTLLLPLLLPSLFAAAGPSKGERKRSDTAQQRQEQRYLCTLLQVSKAWQEAVGSYCKGQLAISATPRSLRQAESFAKWLNRPGMVSRLHMINSLHLDFSMPKKQHMLQLHSSEDVVVAVAQHDSDEDMLQQDSDNVDAPLIAEMQALVAQAIKSAAARIVQTPAPVTGSSALAAASSPTAAASSAIIAPTAGASGGQPVLCRVDIREPSAGLVEALALAGCHTTQLKLRFGGSSDWSHSSMQQLGKALQSLTGLKTLALLDYDDVTDDKGHYVGVDDLIPNLSGLGSLTSLMIQDYDTPLELPSQLHELTYVGFDVDDYAAYLCAHDSQSACVALGSLTSLTQLTYNGGGDFDPTGEYSGLRRDVLHFEDVLPPNLLELHVSGCRDLSCVLDCSKLSALHLESCQASEEQLKQLSVLTSLAEVNLEVCPDKRGPASDIDLCYAAESSNAWVSIPLRRLAFDLDLAAAASDDSSASANTSLELFHLNAQDLLLQLRHQTGLTQLVLGVHLDASESPGVFQQLGLLAKPLKQLSSLQELTIRRENCRVPPKVCAWEEYLVGSPRDFVHHSLRAATATSAHDKDSCQAVAQVIAALTNLRSLRLYGLPTDFVQSVEERLQDCGGRVVLDVTS